MRNSDQVRARALELLGDLTVIQKYDGPWILPRLLILTLPFVAFPRFGSVKIIDVIGFICAVYFLAQQANMPRMIAQRLMLFFLAFSLIAIWRNYSDDISLLSYWDEGLFDRRWYPFTIWFQTSIYLLATAFLATRFSLDKRLLGYFVRANFIYFFVMVAISLSPFAVDFSDDGFFGTFPEKGPFGMYVALVVIVILHFRANVNRRDKFYWYLTLLLAIYLTIISQSTRGLILLMVFIPLYFVLSISRTRISAIAAVIAIMVCAIIFISESGSLFGGKIEEYSSFFMNADKSASAIGRYAGLILAPNLISEYPIFGIGYGNYIYYRDSFEFASAFPLIERDYINNTYLQILVETGWLGFSTFLFFLATAIKVAGKNNIPLIFAMLVLMMTEVPNFYFGWLLFFLLFIPSLSKLPQSQARV